MTTTKQIQEKIDELDERFYLNLESYDVDYYNYLEDTNNQTYIDNLNHTTSIFDKINSDFFLLKNKMERITNDNALKMIPINKNVERFKEENKKMKNKDKLLDEGILTAEGLFNEEVTDYVNNLKAIIIFLIGTLYTLYLIYGLQMNLKQYAIVTGIVLIFIFLILGLLVYIFNKIKSEYNSLR
tara:strand:+ start:1123 stop:1674 length:552 start_codon:yes stop_codon:yes gene_type:complete